MKKILIYTIPILIIIILLLAGYLYRIYTRSIVTTKDYISPLSQNIPTPHPQTPTSTPDPLRPLNILLLGYGGANHDGGYLTDTIILAHIRPREKDVFLINIPRDLWVPLPLDKDQTISHKINAAYAYGRDNHTYPNKPDAFTGDGGGGNLAKYAAEQVTGLHLDYFAAISFQGFQTAIDKLGGITVNVPQSFEDPYYPIEEKQEDPCDHSEEDIQQLTATMSGELLEHQFPCRYETLNFPAGPQAMDGTTALKYARSRHSPTHGGDFNRSLRQRAVLQALKDKIISIGFIPKAFPFITSLTYDFQTDLTLSQANEYLNRYPASQDFQIHNITLSTDNILTEDIADTGQYILAPQGGQDNWSAIHTYIQKQIKEQSTN